MAMSGGKNILSKSNVIKSMGKRQGQVGIREAFFPGMSTSRAAKLKGHLMDLGISPSSRDFGKMMGGIARGFAQKGRRAAGDVAIQKYINRAAGAKKTTWGETMTPALLAGTAGAGILNLNDKRRRRQQRG